MSAPSSMWSTQPPADGGRDRTLTMIAIFFFAQALPLALACLVTGGC